MHLRAETTAQIEQSSSDGFEDVSYRLVACCLRLVWRHCFMKKPFRQVLRNRRIKQPQHLVSAKLSRLYRNGHVERAPDSTSPHTGRKVLRYWLRASP